MNDLVLITFTILLPLTPAYILYKALPARTRVSGPFKGLNIQLSGAFAGYFLLVLVIIGFVSTRPKPLDPTHEVWRVTGNMKFDNSWTDTEKEKLQLSLIPGNQRVYPNGDFEMLVAPEVCEGGKLKFPKLLIRQDGFQTVTIDLDNQEGTYGQISQNVSKDSRSKDIEVKTPIQLQRAAPYNSPQAQQAQVPTQQTGVIQ
jgi:hypothetical protein